LQPERLAAIMRKTAAYIRENLLFDITFNF